VGSALATMAVHMEAIFVIINFSLIE